MRSRPICGVGRGKRTRDKGEGKRQWPSESSLKEKCLMVRERGELSDLLPRQALARFGRLCRPVNGGIAPTAAAGCSCCQLSMYGVLYYRPSILSCEGNRLTSSQQQWRLNNPGLVPPPSHPSKPGRQPDNSEFHFRACRSKTSPSKGQDLRICLSSKHSSMKHGGNKSGPGIDLQSKQFHYRSLVRFSLLDPRGMTWEF